MATPILDEITDDINMISLKRSDGLKNHVIRSSANEYSMKKIGEENVQVQGAALIDHDHGNIDIHRTDGLNCDIIKVFKSMSDEKGDSLRQSRTCSSLITDSIIKRVSCSKIDSIAAMFSSSSSNMSSPPPTPGQ